MSISQLVFFGLFLTFLGSLARADTPSSTQFNEALFGEAIKCAQTALQTYALGTCESAESVMNASIDKCESKFTKAAMDGNDFDHYSLDSEVIDAYNNAIRLVLNIQPETLN